MVDQLYADPRHVSPAITTGTDFPGHVAGGDDDARDGMSTG